MKNLAIVFVLVLSIVLSPLFSPPTHSASFAKVSGTITQFNPTFGPGGQYNTIELILHDPEQGLIWSLMCRRSSMTLGWCANVQVGDTVVAEGHMSSCGVVEVESLFVKTFP